MSDIGTFLPCQPRQAMSAIGGIPADICSLRGFLILTRSRLSELPVQVAKGDLLREVARVLSARDIAGNDARVFSHADEQG